MGDYIAGRNAVLELLKAGSPIDKLYILRGDRKGSIHAILGKANDAGIPVVEVNSRKMEEMAEGTLHQGVIAHVSGYSFYEVEDILEYARERGEAPFLVVLDEIEDPHNTGAIIRTCEAAGVHGVVLTKRRSSGITQVVHKASSGATAHMRIAMVNNIPELLNRLKEKNIWVFGAAGEAETNYTDVNLTGAVCLVIGNEGKGLGRLVRERCDQLVRLPMKGKVDSLNASNAAAILIYEVLRQNAK